MPSTINTAVSHSVTLGAGGYSASLTITGSGSVVPFAAGATAVVLSGNPAYYLDNAGTVQGGAGGSSENEGGTGVLLSAGTVLNTGTIDGGGGGSGGAGGVGVSLTSGTLTNGGTITGGGGGSGEANGGGAGGAGVYLNGGTLITAGTIAGGSGGGSDSGSAGAAGDAVQFGSAAAATLVIDPGAVFQGVVAASTQVNDVLELAEGNGMIANLQGTLAGLGSQYTGFSTFIEDSGARWQVSGTASFSAATIAGSLDLTGGTLTTANGVSLSGSLTVEAGASVSEAGANGTGVSGGAGVSLSSGALTNSGTITGGRGDFGGFDAGRVGGMGADQIGGMVINAGTISGGNGGGSIGASGGAGGAGVYLNGGTLITAGTIAGGSGGGSDSGSAGAAGYAVQFGSAAAATLVIDPGAVFQGVVAASTQVNDVLELAVGNGNQGTLAGLGSQYTGFSTFIEDSGARWQVSGTASFSAATIAGSLDLTGGTLTTANGVSLSGSLTVEAGASVSEAGANGTGVSGGAGVSLSSGALTNSGTITGGRGDFGGFDAGRVGGMGVDQIGGMVINAGTISGGNGGGSIGASGGAGGAGVYLNGGTLITAGTIAGGSGGGSDSGSAGAAGDAVQFGSAAAATLVIDPGAVFQGLVVASASAFDVLQLAGSGPATLDGIGTEFEHFTALTFDKSADWAVSGTAAGLSAIKGINGFAQGDRIVIDNVVEDGFNYANGVLTIDEAGGRVTLDIEGIYAKDEFSVTTDGTNTTVELCYLRGTRILTTTGEVAVEDLRIGDRLVTRFSGIQPVKWIGRQSYDARFVQNTPARMPVRISAGALADGLPVRDLVISPGHSMLVGDQLLLASTLVNGLTITRAGDTIGGRIEYFQIDLGLHDCVIAEGTWSETFADGPDLREQYHNAAEFSALYPEHIPPDELTLCAPRPERGSRLETALRPIVARAAATIAPGRLEGCLDNVIGQRRIEGWALDTAHPDLPVLLDIAVHGQLIGRILACAFRADLLEAGKGLGRCAFYFTAPRRLEAADILGLTVSRTADGAPLAAAAASPALLQVA